MNRHQRRASKSFYSKELRKATFDEFEKVTVGFIEQRRKRGKTSENVFGFFKNSIYSVQIFKYGETHLMGIRRHDEKIMNSWSHAQKIKDELLGEDFFGIQVFPKTKDLIDQANMYWLFCCDGELDPELNLGNYKL